MSIAYMHCLCEGQYVGHLVQACRMTAMTYLRT
jgi:hypothetical protein